jgi:hypothetical protein
MFDREKQAVSRQTFQQENSQSFVIMDGKYFDKKFKLN